jgi:poly(3-hydroxyalkanoate) synthetase
VIETLVAQNKLDAFNNHTSPDPQDPTMRYADCTTKALTSDCRSIHSAYDTAKTVAIVGYVAGGAMALTSAVLFVLSSDHGKATSATAFGCTPTPTKPGFTCGVRF